MSLTVQTPPRPVVPAAPPAAWRRLWAPVERTMTTPWRFVVMMVLVTVAGLGLDAVVGIEGQIVLSVCTWLILLAACVPLSPEVRAQVAVVVMVATCAEVIGSIIWGVYEYRLGNLPLFVPAGHGLVYLAGLSISRTAWALRRPRLLVGIAIVGAVGWALIGLSGVLGRVDVAGAIGVAVLVVFLLKGRAPTVYAGVFLFVAFLEIYGTAVGTWRWAAEIPGLGVADGNPPSGAAAGYVFFDIAALALAPHLLRAWRAAGRRLGLVRAAPASAPAEA
ncbi:MAG: hypothetical protein MUE51_06440 [Thermoleophilia bacterium]|nr:hypothetical protein [Thermoleophilia bacterium]